MKRTEEVVAAMFVIAPLVLACACAGEPGDGPATDVRQGEARGAGIPQDPRRALLVGVGRYHPDSQRDENGERMFPDLNGPSNDVEVVEDLLRSRFGFREADIRTLRDEEATLENVIRAFHEHLVQGCTPDTDVLFWYSGHGSTVPDASGMETTGIDNTLVLHDSRAGGSAGERDLPDDALHSLVAVLPTERVTVITDCCHSGGALRGGESTLAGAVRMAPEGTGMPDPEDWPFWPEGIPLLDDDDPRRGRAPSYVHVAACSFDERAFEVRFPDPPFGYGGSEFGALTWYLVQEMGAAPPGASWRHLVGRARLHVAEVLPHQHVRLEGRGADRSPFAEAVHETLLETTAHPGYADRLQVDGGGLNGLREGGEVAVYRLGGRQPIGHARITRCRGTSATAEWIGEPPEIDKTEALFVRRTSLGAGERPLSVAVGDEEVQKTIARIPWLLPLAEGAKGGYRLARGAGVWVLTGPDGVEIWRSESDAFDEAARRDLENAARDEVHFQRIWELTEAAGAGALSIEARFATPTREECADPAFEAPLRDWGLTGFRPLALPESGTRREIPVRLKTFAAQKGGPGDLVKLEVEAGSQDVYVAVLNLDPATRSIKLDYPDLGQSDNLLRAGQGPLCRFFSVGAPDADHWPSDRPCRDRYLVVATRDRVEFAGLATRDRTRGEGDDSLLDSLEGLDWGVAVVDLLIERAP